MCANTGDVSSSVVLWLHAGMNTSHKGEAVSTPRVTRAHTGRCVSDRKAEAVGLRLGWLAGGSCLGLTNESLDSSGLQCGGEGQRGS